MAVVANEWCHTYPAVKAVRFEWTINNFMVRCSSDHAPLSSSPFSQDGLQWCLQINLTRPNLLTLPCTSQQLGVPLVLGQARLSQSARQSDVNSDKCSLKIALVSSASPVWATYKFTLVSTTEPVYTKECNETRKFQPGNDTPTYVGFDDFISVQQIKKFLESDQLTIQCEVKILVNDSRIHHSSAQVLLPVSTYKTNFNSLLEDGSYSDVTLVAGGKEFKSHKLVLCARSPVFAKMFEHDMTENAKNQVDITDIEPDILKELLTYIYMDESPLLEKPKQVAEPKPNTEENATNGSHKKIAKLLYAAEKYQLDRLKAMCEATMSRDLTVNTATEVLLFADLHSTKGLKKSCIRFIGANYAEVTKTQAWMEAAGKDNAIIETIQAIFDTEL